MAAIRRRGRLSVRSHYDWERAERLAHERHERAEHRWHERSERGARRAERHVKERAEHLRHEWHERKLQSSIDVELLVQRLERPRPYQCNGRLRCLASPTPG